VLAVGASAASASTLYVDERGEGKDHCLGENFQDACATIGEAVQQAEAAPGINTIEVAEGEYKEPTIELDHPADKGLTINGEEPGVKIVNKGGFAIVAKGPAGEVTLSNLSVVDQSGSSAVIADRGAELTLNDVAVDNESGTGVNGVEAREPGSVTINGGSVEMENGAVGYAITATESALTLNGVNVTVGAASPGEAGGVSSSKSGLSMAGSTVRIIGGNKEQQVGIATGEDGAVSLREDVVEQSSPALGVALEISPATVEGLTIDMEDAASKAFGLGESTTLDSTFEHVEVSGPWKGIPFLGVGGGAKVADSHLVGSSGDDSAALDYVGLGEGSALLVQRSVLQAAPGALATLAASNSDVTADSTEILGGIDGVHFENTAAQTSTLTLAASTVDAGVPGVSGDAFGVSGVDAIATGASSVANVAIEGSIVLEPQAASSKTGGQTSVSCTYTAMPSQTQAAKGSEGSIACPAGSGGNTDSNAELSSLFAEPFTSYKLSPTSTAIDSVPVSAITLPSSLTPSSTDLEGRPRFEDVDCVAMQDKGALQLPGHSTVCPTATPSMPTPNTGPASPRPLAGVITGLLISPSAFLPAPSGATISTAKKAKKKYGATISYRDSQIATTTFTVLRESAGRKQGKSCKKPSKKNKHGKACTLLAKVGSFTHIDVTAANSLRFSGRIAGKKLTAGSYELQAVAHDAAGNGPTATKSFKIK
jgi:hypothetical protein